MKKIKRDSVKRKESRKTKTKIENGNKKVQKQLKIIFTQ
jgi:hypothetical protein